jgi:hypothetical protein
MLKIIEPSSHEDYQSEIDTLLYLFQVSQKVELPLEEKVKSTFIIAKDPKCGVYGGAILRKRPLYALDERIEAVLSTLHSKSRKVWFVQLCACMVECETLSREDKITLFKSFYSSLYKKFMMFGKKRKTNFLVLSLTPSDCVITSTYQEWPYILEVLPNDTLDNLFQGILALKPALKLEKRTDDKRVKPSPDLVNSLNPVNSIEEAPL